MNFRLYRPVKPGTLNQGFGSDQKYYSKFHDDIGNPLGGHDGLDFYAPHGTPVYAAHEGMIHYEKDAHGGEGMWLRDLNNNYDNITGTPITNYWHLIGGTEPAKYPSPIPLDGKEYPVKTGDLIGYADNTGAPYESSGDHLHFGLLSATATSTSSITAMALMAGVIPRRSSPKPSLRTIPKTIGLYQKLIPILQQLYATVKAHYSACSGPVIKQGSRVRSRSLVRSTVTDHHRATIAVAHIFVGAGSPL